MARLRAFASSTSRANSTTDSLYRTPSIPPPPRAENSPNLANGASPGSGSDKENQEARRAAIRAGKMPVLGDQSARGSKRRRLGERDESIQYESSLSGSDNEEQDEDEEDEEQDQERTSRVDHNNGPRYDPHQDMDERRKIRRDLREIDKEMQDSRTEWMAPDSRALEEALVKQNALFASVKQTSDATIDSRMLVNASDITHKRTKNLNVGESAQGIDLDEFVGKCMTFMLDSSGENNISNTQRRRGLGSNEDEDEDGVNQGDALDWSFLGTQACFPFNVRPPTIGFMLGPLSVQKRPRQSTQRRAPLRRSGPVETVKARELKSDDLKKANDSSVVPICNKLNENFLDLYEAGRSDMEAFWDKKESDGVTEEEERQFEDYNYIMSDGGVHFFKFVIHPTSFAQSSENLFYLSFLLKDDLIKIVFDPETEMPSLHPIDEKVRSDQQRHRGPRHQAVFGLDFPTWESLVKVFNIKETMIPDRSEEYAATQQLNTNSWY